MCDVDIGVRADEDRNQKIRVHVWLSADQSHVRRTLTVISHFSVESCTATFNFCLFVPFERHRFRLSHHSNFTR